MNHNQSEEENENTPTSTATKMRGTKSSRNRRKQTKELRKSCNCKNGCGEKLLHERRSFLNQQYWKKSVQGQRSWLKSYVDQIPIKRKRIRESSGRNRQSSYTYHLPDESGLRIKVWQIFFLNTLDYSSNKVLVNLFVDSAGDICAKPDKRGKHAPKHKLSEENELLIRTHINSFNPAISHYRRKHAPNRRHLSPELNAHIMYEDFTQQNPHVRIKYVTYWRQIRKMKISFTKLGEEECEICLEKVSHRKREITLYDTTKCISDLMNEMLNDVDCKVNLCKLCSDHERHLQRANISRNEYKNNSIIFVPDENETMVAVDVQKVCYHVWLALKELSLPNE